MDYEEEIKEIQLQIGQAYAKLAKLARRMEDQGGLATVTTELREAKTKCSSAYLDLIVATEELEIAKEG